MRVPKAIKEGDESNLFLEFLYICNVFTKLDDLIRPKSITQAQKRIKKPKLTFPLIGQDFPTVHPCPLTNYFPSISLKFSTCAQLSK